MAWLGLRSEQVAVHGAEDLFLLPACQRIHIKNAIWKMSRDREQEAKSKRQFWGGFLSFHHGFLFCYQMNESELFARPSDVFSR